MNPTLSIIIPCYNAGNYIKELIKCLEKQILPDGEVEVILIDDGSTEPVKNTLGYKAACPSWLNIIRQKNGGVSKARNKGLDTAKGKYIAFIDADDMVSENYLELILSKIKDEEFDYCYLSWRTMAGGWQQKIQIRSIKDKFPPFNLCVWNRIYKRDLIGDTRFNEKKAIAEDAEFIRGIEKGKKAFISEFVYYYRSNVKDSLTKRFARGEIPFKRIVYYYSHITSDMKELVAEVAKADEEAEVIILTNQNDLPELERHAMVMPPCQIKATEIRGEKNNYIQLIPQAIKTQVVVWTKNTFDIGGIETFNFEFVKALSKYYDIMLLYEGMDVHQIMRASKFVECRKNDVKLPIICDTLIVNRIIDDLPPNVHAKQTVQMVHGVKHGNYHVPQDKDIIVSVSEAVKTSFGEETKDSVVIPNMLDIKPSKDKPLLLVSTTRMDCEDKGTNRMIALANLMEAQKVNYIWLCFTNRELPPNAPKKMVRMKPTLDIIDWVQRADYLVQLSDHEAFCYSIAEALAVNTPIIVTPLDVLSEFGFEEGKHGYIVPFKIGADFDTTSFLKVPTFSYKRSNKQSIDLWRKLLGDTTPTHSYKPSSKVMVRITHVYDDLYFRRKMKLNEVVPMPDFRAKIVIDAGYGRKEE